MRARQIAIQLALQELDFGTRELIERLEILVGGNPRVGDDQNAVLNMIEREYRVEHHETGVVGSIGAFPEIASPLDMKPVQAEAILLILLVLVGHGLVWDFMVRAQHRAGQHVRGLEE